MFDIPAGELQWPDEMTSADLFFRRLNQGVQLLDFISVSNNVGGPGASHRLMGIHSDFVRFKLKSRERMRLL